MIGLTLLQGTLGGGGSPGSQLMIGDSSDEQ